jgi:Leucine-rich repeat (LRR) protein
MKLSLALVAERNLAPSAAGPTDENHAFPSAAQTFAAPRTRRPSAARITESQQANLAPTAHGKGQALDEVFEQRATEIALLKRVRLDRMQLEDVEALTALQCVTHLYLQYNAIADIADLVLLPQLVLLTVEGNCIEHLPDLRWKRGWGVGWDGDQCAFDHYTGHCKSCWCWT